MSGFLIRSVRLYNYIAVKCTADSGPEEDLEIRQSWEFSPLRGMHREVRIGKERRKQEKSTQSWLFLRLRGLGGGGGGWTINSPPALYFSVETARAHQFHILGQDQSTVAQRAETTVAE